MSNNWSKVKLGDISREITVGFVGSMASEYVDDGILFLRSQNILPYKLNLTSKQIKYISESFHKKINKSRLRANDIAIVRTGYPGTACVIPENFEEVNCSDLVIVRPNQELADSYFLCYFINSPLGKGAISGNLVGAAQQHFNVGVAKQMSLLLPPLPTQKKIANILSAYDDLIENNNQRIQVLEEMAAEIYKEWFVRFRFLGYESATFVDKEGKKVPQGMDGALPLGWERVRLGNVIEQVKRKPKIKKDDYRDKGLYPIIDQGEKLIAGYTNEEKYVQREPLPILVFGDHTRRLKFIDFAFVSGADGTQFLVPKNKSLLPTYFYLAVSRIDLSNFHYARHFKFLKQEYILIPTKNVVEHYNKMTTPFLKEIDLLRAKNKTLQQTRDLLLPRLISGKLSVENLALATEEEKLVKR